MITCCVHWCSLFSSAPSRCFLFPFFFFSFVFASYPDVSHVLTHTTQLNPGLAEKSTWVPILIYFCIVGRRAFQLRGEEVCSAQPQSLWESVPFCSWQHCRIPCGTITENLLSPWWGWNPISRCSVLVPGYNITPWFPLHLYYFYYSWTHVPH